MPTFNRVLTPGSVPVAIVEGLAWPLEVQYYVDNGGFAGNSFWLSFGSPITLGDRKLYAATQPVTERWAAGTNAYVSWDGASPQRIIFTITPDLSVAVDPRYAIQPMTRRGMPEPHPRALYTMDDLHFTMKRLPRQVGRAGKQGMWDYKFVPGLLSSHG